MNQTPYANRLHIALFGRRNSGKSSLVNALTGQDTVIVSPTPGTTTDPVTKAMEIHPLGPCLLIDTPGFDDEGELGEMRVERTLKIIGKTDIALLLCETGDAQEQEWLQRLNLQAPKGRLILPQVQTIRELLDKKCLIMSCTTDKLKDTLCALANPPQLIITDSQVFHTVYEQKPAESRLTSFSVLFAGYKGDIHYYVESTFAIDRLTEQSRVLIAEACTHAPLTEDIGRVKIPHLLRKRTGEGLQIDIVSGNDFPEDLSPYNLIIHCGACMFNRKYVLSRIEQARAQQVPMTNYGVAIAHLNGILNKIVY